MIYKKPNLFLSIIMLLFSMLSFAQIGVVSGVLSDEFGPISDITIKIKGTQIKTVTDFDGNYAIRCKVGDILVFEHISYASRETKVTRKMFGNKKVRNKKIISQVKQKQVLQIYNNAYSELVNSQIDSTKRKNTKFFKNGLTYKKSKSRNNSFYDINEIIEKDSVIHINYNVENIYFKIDYKSNIGLQFVSNQSIPNLQNTFVQGRPFNGVHQWFGAETNEIFSFGPNRNTLQFNNENYNYDNNGSLVLGNNSTKILPYKNDIFNTSLVNSNSINFILKKGYENKSHYINLNLFNKKRKDLFNRKKSKITQFSIQYRLNSRYNFGINHSINIDNQPNTNGFLNNILLNNYITPISFQNSQEYIFNDSSQRHFSNQFNNPLWLLNLNNNQNKTTNSIYNFNSNLFYNDYISIHTFLNYAKNETNYNFTLPKNTVGFENGYLSKKRISNKQFNAKLIANLNFSNYNHFFNSIDINNTFDYKNYDLNYRLNEQSGFINLDFQNPLNESLLVKKANNVVFHFSNEVKLDLKHWSFLTVKNNAIISSLQGNKLFLPSVQYFIDLRKVFQYPNWLNYSTFAIGFAEEANSIPLFYQNKSHQSLNLLPQQSQSFLANNDLFNSKNLEFETATQFEIETYINIKNIVETSFKYYNSITKNAVFPIYENHEFSLKNIANTKNNGIEVSLKLNIGRRWDNDIQYIPSFIFSKNKTKVLSLRNNLNSIAIAGFSTISKNLIIGKQTGTIVGSAYLRNQNGDRIIDNQGFPIVDTEKQIIGNTTPNFNLSFSNVLTFKNLRLSFIFNYQNGGDVWQGTQNILNYFGRSQKSATLRETTNYIFKGVNQQGNPNTILVDFANPNQDINQNRWVRYGYSGVAEDVIIDGTYLNLKTINLTYDIKNISFFRNIKISLYANNLLTFTKNKSIIPNSSLFDYSSSKGLDYFNLPLVKEIGFKINLNI